ncbi:MAG: T9SS type A sorting domain-containing protein [Bacteroidales bacterium]|nr:T9SS type A sorting domain-containing protein [Bacteroidales bacterium]
MEFNNLDNFNFRMKPVDGSLEIRTFGKTYIKNNTDYYLSTVFWTGDFVFMFLNGGLDAVTPNSKPIANVDTKVKISETQMANIAEIIMFKDDISDLQRIIIENYLAAKYDLKLKENDYDDFSLINADANIYRNRSMLNDIIGIGKRTFPAFGSEDIVQKTEKGGLILESTTLEDGDIIMAGHNGAAVNNPFNWPRYWYVVSTNPNAEVKLTFDFAAAGTIDPTNPSSYKLWYLADGTTSWVNTNVSPVPDSTSKLSFTVPDIGTGYYVIGETAPTISALKDIEENRNFIYPNPATDQLNFTFDFATGYRIFDLTGSLIHSGSIKTNQLIFQILNTGVYLIELNIHDERIVGKFLKK